MQNIILLFYNFPKVPIILCYNEVPEIDFENNISNVSKKEEPMMAVDLPLKVSREYVRKISDIKYDKSYIIYRSAGQPVNFFVNHNNKRHDVKDIVDLTQGHYMIICQSSVNEV